MTQLNKTLVRSLWISLALLAGGATPIMAQRKIIDSFKSKDIHTPDYYDSTVRSAFKRGNWEGGKRLLDEGLKRYPDISALNELAGQYYYHKRAYDDARFYLVRALRDNNANVDAKNLIIKVEEETRNYSSAICYVNELLEIHPYWKGLWRKKIELYRKQKNDVEADRLLERLCHIYPNDAQLKKDFEYRLEQQALTERNAGNKDGAIDALKRLVNSNPKNEEHYLMLCNLLLQQGRRSEAIDVADRGATNIPSSYRLISKKASILAEENRYGEALAFLNRCMKTNHSGQLASLYNQLQEDAARAAAQNDAYTLYSKVYERTKSQESLDYLLATSITRGYYDDALTYIAAERKRKGDTEDLLYKAYIVNRRMGNTHAASNLLDRLYRRNPRNKDVADELARERLEKSIKLMSEGSYGEALPLLEFAAEHAVDKEVRESAYSRIVTSNIELRRYTAAEQALANYRAHFPGKPDIVFKNADILSRSGRTEAALSLLAKACNEEQDQLVRAQYVNAYEETAVPYIKQLMEKGSIAKAYAQSLTLIEIFPMSEDGLHYAVNASAMLKKWNEHRQWVALGRQRFENDNFYVAKQAALYTNARKFANAEDLLAPRVSEYMGDSLLIKANSTNSSDWAIALLDRHENDSALAVVNAALEYDSDNNLLLYTKGLIFEAKHQYDSAYVYQKYYKPGFGEVGSFRRHLEGLISRGYRNGINFEYLQGRYGEEDVLTAVAAIEYTRKLDDKNSIAIRFNYAGREGSVPGVKQEEQQSGGTGLQLQGEWTRILNDRWQATVNAAIASKYFPQLMANLRLQRSFSNELEGEVHVGFRHIDSFQKKFQWNADTFNEETQTWGAWGFSNWENKRKMLLNFGVGASKTYGDFWVNAKLDGYNMNSKFYLNLLAQTKYFFMDDGKSCIHALASVGSAPEATMIDYAMPGTFNRLNTQVGLGGQYRVHRNVTLGLLGMWYTYYTQSNYRTGTDTDFSEVINTRYKNLFNIDVQILIAF